MKVLLDTVLFLDSALASTRLSGRATEVLMDPGNELYVSIVSYWEIAIKHSLGKLKLSDNIERFIPQHRAKLGADLLPLDEESVLHVTRLPHIHRDPFDRILICQAIVHGMVLVTSDARILQYPVRTAW